MICALDILIKFFLLFPSVDQQGPSFNSSISQTPKMLKYYKVRIDCASTVEERMKPERTLSWVRLCNPHPSRPTTAASWASSTFRTRRRPRRTRTWKGVSIKRKDTIYIRGTSHFFILREREGDGRVARWGRQKCRLFPLGAFSLLHRWMERDRADDAWAPIGRRRFLVLQFESVVVCK